MCVRERLGQPLGARLPPIAALIIRTDRPKDRGEDPRNSIPPTHPRGSFSPQLSHSHKINTPFPPLTTLTLERIVCLLCYRSSYFFFAQATLRILEEHRNVANSGFGKSSLISVIFLLSPCYLFRVSVRNSVA